jgi:hypothetical protein
MSRVPLEEGAALARAVAPEALAKASRAGEIALSEILNVGIHDSSRNQAELVRRLNPENLAYITRMSRLTTWRDDADMVTHRGTRPYTWREQDFITSLDKLGIRALRPEQVRTARLSPDGEGFSATRYTGTDFRFLKREDLPFSAIETRPYPGASKAVSEFPDAFKASLTTDSRVVMRRAISNTSDHSDARFTQRSLLNLSQIDRLLQDGNTKTELTRALLPELYKRTLSVQLEVLSPGRSTLFEFGRSSINHPKNRPPYEDWMRDSFWTQETRVKSATPSTKYDRQPVVEQPPAWEHDKLQREFAKNASKVDYG